MRRGNIFAQIPEDLTEERFEDLVEEGVVRVERIISAGQASPDGFWYDQEKSELVILLCGSAGLSFREPDETIVLKPGDWINIPAHRKHRVEWTDPKEKTIWLATHY